MDTSTMDALTNALNYGSARLQALSNNLTNINTPGYQRKDVSFDALLQAASADAQGGGDLSLERTDPRQIATDEEARRTQPLITTQSGSSMRQDGNNVDVDAESSRLAATEIFYQGAAQLMQGQFASLKYAITGGGS